MIDHIKLVNDQVNQRLSKEANRGAFKQAYDLEHTNSRYRTEYARRHAARAAGVKALAVQLDTPTCETRVIGPDLAIARMLGRQVKAAIQHVTDTCMKPGVLKKYYTRCYFAEYVPGLPFVVKLIIAYALERALDRLLQATNSHHKSVNRSTLKLWNTPNTAPPTQTTHT